MEENELLQRKMDERSEDVHKLLLGKRQHMEELQRCQEDLEEAQVLRIVFTLSLLCCCVRSAQCFENCTALFEQTPRYRLSSHWTIGDEDLRGTSASLTPCHACARAAARAGARGGGRDHTGDGAAGKGPRHVAMRAYIPGTRTRPGARLC